MIRVTNQFEIEVSSGAHYWDCFRGVDLRRTEIAAMVWVTQSFCGVPFMAYGVQFMRQAGLATEDSYSMNLGQNAIGLVGCFIAWWIMTYVGRRTLYLAGLSAMFVILMIIGFLGIPTETASISWAVGSLIILMLFLFQLSVGPACYTLVAEMPSTRLRIKTVALARALYNTAGFITNAIMPKIVGKNDWNWGAKGAFFWAGIDAIFLIWTFFRLPEPFGLTYSELDLLFEHGTSARHFSQEAADLLKPQLEEVAHRQDKVTRVASAME
jgi:MFS transporter, SP family, general alpha glucoside:H+ symporter